MVDLSKWKLFDHFFLKHSHEHDAFESLTRVTASVSVKSSSLYQSRGRFVYVCAASYHECVYLHQRKNKNVRGRHVLFKYENRDFYSETPLYLTTKTSVTSPKTVKPCLEIIN